MLLICFLSHAVCLYDCLCRYDHTCKLWDVRQKRCLVTLDHGAPIESVAFFPTGDAQGSSTVSCLLHKGMHAGALHRWIFNSMVPICCAGSLLVTAGGTDICIWHMLGSGQLVHRISAHQKTVTSVLVASMTGQAPHIMSAGLDGYVKVGRGQQCCDNMLYCMYPVLSSMADEPNIALSHSVQCARPASYLHIWHCNYQCHR